MSEAQGELLLERARRVADTVLRPRAEIAAGLDHPAERWFREAMVYTLNAQTRDVQEATLSLLVRAPR